MAEALFLGDLNFLITISVTINEKVEEYPMPRRSITEMKVSEVYPLLVAKAERKGRTKEEVDEIICWLTGWDMEVADRNMSYGDFFEQAPAYNPASDQITGTICGVRVETISDPLMKKIRQLDKLIDELAKGRQMDRILRS